MLGVKEDVPKLVETLKQLPRGGWRNGGVPARMVENSSIKGEKKKGARSSQSIAITILAIRTPRRDVAFSIRLPNRFLPSQSSPSPVLICCQIMFASVILTWADCARDSLIIAALDRPRRYCAPATLRPAPPPPPPSSGLSAYDTGHDLLLFRRKLNLLSVVKRHASSAHDRTRPRINPSPLIAVKVAAEKRQQQGLIAADGLIGWMHPGADCAPSPTFLSSLVKLSFLPTFAVAAHSHIKPPAHKTTPIHNAQSAD